MIGFLLSPFGLTLLLVVAGGPALLCFIYMVLMPKGGKAQSGVERRRDLDRADRNKLIGLVNKVYSSFNLKTIQNLTSEMMFLTLSATCHVLQKVGIRKMVEFQVDQQREAISPDPMAWSDGKNSGLVDVVFGSYTERYVDSSSDKVLYEKNWPKAVLTFSAVKANQTDNQTAKFCTQCGSPIEMKGDFYDCSRCGAHYAADAYLWTMTGIQVDNELKNNDQVKAIGVAAIVLLAFAAITTFSPFGIMHILVYLIDAALIFAGWQFLVSAKRDLQGLIDCQDYDPLFSRQAFQRRAEYLYRLYRQACDVDRTIIKSFLDSAAYAELSSDTYTDGMYFLDYEFKKLIAPTFRIEDGMQKIDCTLHIMEVSVDERKRIKKEKKKVRMMLVRDEGCKTLPKTATEQYTCSHCGANMNPSRSGTCSYCGNQIDLKKYDWCIDSLEVI